MPVSEDQANMVALPCGCVVDKEAKDTICSYRQENLGLMILQCAKCMRVIGIDVFQPKQSIILGARKVGIG